MTEARSLTHGPLHHFFGYYDKCPWSPDQRHIALQEVAFADRNPTANDALTIGLVSASGGPFQPVATTRAWNWQQGCMLRWHPGYSGLLMYNDCVADGFVTMGYDVATGENRQLYDHATYDIASDGGLAASLNFARVGTCRPGYGYEGIEDPFAGVAQPDEDGFYLLDTATGRSELTVSIRQAAEIGEVRPAATCKAWFNHLYFSPHAKHLLFLHRWADEACRGHVGFTTRVMILEIATGAIRCISEGRGASHYDWYDDDHLLIFLYHEDGAGFYLIDVRDGQLQPVGIHAFSLDGHCLYRPQRDWFVTDTYPRGPRREQPLLLYHPESGQRLELGAFPAMPVSDPACRCDLHTRWNRDGTQLCFDSTHEGSRQVYTVDVSDMV